MTNIDQLSLKCMLSWIQEDRELYHDQETDKFEIIKTAFLYVVETDVVSLKKTIQIGLFFFSTMELMQSLSISDMVYSSEKSG